MLHRSYLGVSTMLLRTVALKEIKSDNGPVKQVHATDMFMADRLCWHASCNEHYLCCCYFGNDSSFKRKQRNGCLHHRGVKWKRILLFLQKLRNFSHSDAGSNLPPCSTARQVLSARPFMSKVLVTTGMMLH